MNHPTPLLLDAAAASNQTIPQALLFGSIALVFYFFMIRPQQKRQRDQKNFLTQLKKGDALVTIGGIHGKVYAVEEDTVTLEIDNKGAKLTISKGAIGTQPPQQK